MKEQLAKMQRVIEDEKSSRDQYFELRSKELKNFESKIIEKFDNETIVMFFIRTEKKLTKKYLNSLKTKLET